MSNQLKEFENQRWTKKDQPITTRHTRALNMINSGNVLDIGCGDGLFLEMLKKKGVKGWGVDISPVAVEKCKSKGIDAIVHNFSDGPLPPFDTVFDYVVLLDVLEHNYNPELILNEAAKVKSKYVIISVPNFNSLPARLQILFGKVPENNRPNKGHVYWFNQKSLLNVIDKAGLKVVEDHSHTFWKDKKIIGNILKKLNKVFPSVLSLSFIYKLAKKNI